MAGVLGFLKKKKDELLSGFANSKLGQNFTQSKAARFAEGAVQKGGGFVRGFGKTALDYAGGQFGSALGKSFAARRISQMQQDMLDRQRNQDEIIINRMKQANTRGDSREQNRLKLILNSPNLQTNFTNILSNQDKSYQESKKDIVSGAFKTGLSTVFGSAALKSPLSTATSSLGFGGVGNVVNQKLANPQKRINWNDVGQSVAQTAMLSPLWKANARGVDKVLTANITNKITHGLARKFSEQGSAATAKTIVNLAKSGVGVKQIAPSLGKIFIKGVGRGLVETIPDNLTYSTFKKATGDKRKFSDIIKQDLPGDMVGNIVGNTILPGGALWQGIGAWRKGAKDFKQKSAKFLEDVPDEQKPDMLNFYRAASAVKNGVSNEATIGNIKKLKKIVGLPNDTPEQVVMRARVLEELLSTKHPDKKNFTFNDTLDFIKTINIPERWQDLNDNRKLAIYHQFDDMLNKTVVKPIPVEGKTFLTSSYITNDPNKIKKWKRKSNKLTSSQEGLADAHVASPSSPGGIGASNFPTSEKVNANIVPSNQQKLNSSDDYWNSLSKQADSESKVKDTTVNTQAIPSSLDLHKQIEENVDFYNKQIGKSSLLKSVTNPLNLLSETDRASFDNWRRAGLSSGLEANHLAKQVDKALGNPDSQTAWKITQFMQNPTEQTAKALGLENTEQYQEAIGNMRRIYNDLYNEVTSKTGKKANYLENYVPQIWQEPQEKIEQIARSAGIKPSWMNKRIIPDYQTGVALGLTPKYTHPGQLLAEYYTKAQKALASNKLINSLVDSGVLVSGRKPSGWSEVNSDSIATKKLARSALAANLQSLGVLDKLPRDQRDTILAQASAKEMKLYAPKSIATVLNNIFGEGSKGSATLGLAATANKRMQNFVLSGGIPGTPFNSFTIGQAIKEITGGNPAVLKSFARSFSNKASEQFMEAHQPTIKMMAQQGISINTGHDYKTEFKNILGGDDGIIKYLDKGFTKLFEEPTFQRFMPMKNIEYFETIYDNAITNGKSSEEAAEIAGKMTKSWMGLIDNYARNRKLQQTINSIFFAPDYREGMLNFWTNLVKAVPNIAAPENRQFLKFGVGTVITYGLYNIVNKFLTGRYMWENKSGKKLSFEIPENENWGGETGRSLFMGILPSVATMPRNAAEIGLAILQGDGDTVKQKLGSYFSMPIKLGSELLANQDYFGNPIRDVESSVGNQVKQTASYVSGDYLHPFAGAAVDLITRRRNLLETALKVAETPLYGSRSSDAAGLTKKQYQTFQNLSKQGNNAKAYALQAKELKRQKDAVKKGINPNAGWWDSLWGNNKITSFTPSENTVLRATQKSVIKDKIKQMDLTVTPEELSFAYLYDIERMPASNRYETAQRNNKLYGVYDDIVKDEYLSPEQKAYLSKLVRNNLGKTQEDMDYYLKASAANNNLKTLAVYDDLDKLTLDNNTTEGHEQLLAYLVESRRIINNKLLATDGVIDNLYHDNLITNEERKWLKNLDWDEEKGDWKLKKLSTKSKKQRSVSTIAKSLHKIKIKSSPASAIKISSPQISKADIKPIKIVSSSKHIDLGAPNINPEALIKIASTTNQK